MYKKKNLSIILFILFLLYHIFTYFSIPFGINQKFIGSNFYQDTKMKIYLKGAIFEKKFINFITIKAISPEPEIHIRANPKLIWAMLNLTITNVNPEKAIVHGAATSELYKFKRGIKFSIRVGSRKKIDIRIEQKNTEFKFLVFGDSRGSDSPFSNLRGSFFVWNKIIKQAIKKNVSFMIDIGDLINSGKFLEYLRLNKQIKKIKYIPFYPVIGNHEIRNRKGTKYYRKFFGPTYYYFIYKKCLFVILDNSNGNLPLNSLNFLKEVFEKYKNLKKFVFLHKPLFDPREDSNYVMEDKKQRNELIKIFKYYKVDTVFSSHIHGYFDFIKNGVRYIITGGGGARLRVENGFYHAILVEPDKNKYEVIKINPSPTFSWIFKLLFNVIIIYFILILYLEKNINFKKKRD